MATATLEKYYSVSAYKTRTQDEHVITNTEMYIGNRAPNRETATVFDGNRVYEREIVISEALNHLFKEIISNASDNADRSRAVGINPGKIYISMNETTVAIRNEGIPIAVSKTADGTWLPELIFGKMLTSSNYSEERLGAGVNGLGAKVTNILSNFFSVEIYDGISHLHYYQDWQDHKRIVGEPRIQPYPGSECSVTITYVADFSHFGFTQYTQDFLDLYRYNSLYVSCNSKIPVIFNGVEYNITNVREFATYFFSQEVVEKSLIHYEWPPNTEIIRGAKGVQRAANPAILPLVELLVLDTPGEGRCYSFVNCMPTNVGGVHVEAALNAAVRPIVDRVNEKVNKRLQRAKIEPSRKYLVNMGDVKANVSLLLMVKVTNPRFSGQRKEKYDGPAITINIPEAQLKALDKWNLVDRLDQIASVKEEGSGKKTDGRKRHVISFEKGIDASYAGKRGQAQNCILLLPEGVSASGTVSHIVRLCGMQQYWGVCNLRGKPLNVRDCNRFQLNENEVFNNIKEFLGLVDGTDYSIPANFNKLRYHRMMICADSDDDGQHIIGLILNFFEQRFPSLCNRNFILFLRTPLYLIRSLGLRFYTEREFRAWKETVPNFKGEIVYVKGLGTLDESKDLPSIVKQDLARLFIDVLFDPYSPEWLDMAFNRKRALDRKRWIVERSANPLEIEIPSSLTVTNFINGPFFNYTSVSVTRSVPDAIDGFKPSTRKIIHTLYNSTKTKKTIKVAQLAADTASLTKYHYGEKSLEKAIIGMARSYPGSNNVPLLNREGQFGTRFKGGEDASGPRYIFVSANEKVFKLMFRPEDLAILDYQKDEDDQVEPFRYYPIIPNVLINGVEGIGTGFSTTIPPYHPLQVVDWLLARLSGTDPEQLPMLVPYYHGYRGQIELVTGKTAANPDPEEDPFSDPEIGDFFDGDRTKYSVVTTGCFKVEHNNGSVDIRITELPIGVVPLKYSTWLQELNEKLKFCSKVECLGCCDEVDIVLKDYQGDGNLKFLRLQRSFGITNMVLLDEKRSPMIFESVKHILEYFYRHRLPIYQVRKDHQLKEIEKNILKLQEKLRLCNLVLSNRDAFIGVRRSDIMPILSQNQISEDTYKGLSLSGVSLDKMEKLQKEIDEQIRHYYEYQNKDIKAIWYEELMQLRAVFAKY